MAKKRGRKSPPKKRAPPRKAPPKKRAPPKRVDWSKKKAPKEGSKARAAYERSAVYKARSKAARAGLVTRRKHEQAEQRRLLREERIAAAKDALRPLLTKIVNRWKQGQLRHGHKGGWIESREAHGNWYAAKLNLADYMPERDYLRMLGELTDEYDLDDLGWDIIY
jgi:hypothetical protein